MFLSFFIPVGVFLLLAAKRPSEHRSMIALAAWWNIAHGTVMAIQTVEARMHGVHRNFADVIVFTCDRSRLVSASASKTRGSGLGRRVNERGNPHAARINRWFVFLRRCCCFFRFSFRGFFSSSACVPSGIRRPRVPQWHPSESALTSRKKVFSCQIYALGHPRQWLRRKRAGRDAGGTGATSRRCRSCGISNRVA